MYQQIDHPLIADKLTRLRQRDTQPKEFRELTAELTMLLAYEALKAAEIDPVDIETPLTRTTGSRLRHEIVIVPILRAGVGMLDALLKLVPAAKVGFLGMYRDPETKLPCEYYAKLPLPTANSLAIIIDPMLATGGSTNAAICYLKTAGFKTIVVVSILAAPEGITAVEADHPDVSIVTAAVDQCLDDHKYIVPGLGDAGDRLFGTR